MKIVIALLAFYSLTAWSQENTQKELTKEYFRIYYSNPNGIGNNVISKANDGKGGFGLGITFVTFDRFHIIAGYEINTYEVTDRSLAGNMNETTVWQLYAGVLYKIPVTKRFDINPELSLGTLTVSQKLEGGKRGKQAGPSINPGFTMDYSISGNFRVFAGLKYCIAFPSTNTNEEYKSFFGTIQMLNIVAGIKL